MTIPNSPVKNFSLHLKGSLCFMCENEKCEALATEDAVKRLEHNKKNIYI